tara:strand:+ start:1810 stop:2343 length:534 start_codon:yes stop_codon:yes gene_type:complete
MPIAAIPQGIELRKISAGQQKAIDELLKKQKETSLLNTAIPTTALLVIAGGAAATFLFKDQIQEWAKEQTGNLFEAFKQKVVDIATGSGRGIADIITNAIGRDEPKTPPTFTDAQGNVLTIPRCTRWETDYVDSISQAQAGGDITVLALAQLNIIKNMKAEGCERPVTIPQSQWNKV